MTTHNSITAKQGQRIDHWVDAGGVVVASNERLARSLQGAYNRRREAEGITAWSTPPIYEWKAFVRQQWDRHFADGRMVLSSLQEEWLLGGLPRTAL